MVFRLLSSLFRARAPASDRDPLPRILVGLGNPGPTYEATRHNVGWWFLDHLARERGFGPFRQEGVTLAAHGTLAGEPVILLKPLTWMNRSGAAVAPWAADPTFDPAHHLLVVVDDATRDAGKVRLRAEGGHGGHNGLRSIEATLGTQAWARLRLGVGAPPKGQDLAEWVLAPPPEEDEARILGLFPGLVEGLEIWIREGSAPAMNRVNR